MSSVPRRGWAFGVAGGGVLLGHWITYSLVAPGAAERTTLLASTGHAYLGAAYQVGLALTLVAFAALFLGQVIRPLGAPSSSGLTLRLAGFQAAAFMAMEISERLASGAPIGELFHGLLLPIGLVVQLCVAGLGTLAIRWILRAADIAAGSAVVPPLSRRTATSLVMAPALPPAMAAFGRPTGRAPPTFG